MPAPTDGRRTKRVAELIQRHFADVLRREVDDPRFAAVVITGVDVSDDLLIANLGVRLLVAEDDEKQRRLIVDRLRRAAPRLRRAITPRLELKRAPELRFHYDVGPDAHQRVSDLLREVEAERQVTEDDDENDADKT
ncbi:MAG: ribosome-binding factor [Polyangiaceae bacterium]|jgi:ribosome-binding factor A|nr:ribosome-binding factor [Polyangiaceae bacterium]